MRIPLAKPEIGPAEREAALRVLAGTTLACGPEIAAFEGEFAKYTESKGAVAMNSGTSGLIAALAALGVGSGDEVLIPAFTFVATANAVLHRGAQPVLVDVDPVTMSITPETLVDSMGPQTRAVIVVHLFGRPVSMDAVVALARQHDCAVIEDACEALGARWGDRSVGSSGDAGVFGFYPNKPMTTGEGGMLVADDPEVLSRCRALANQGRDGEVWVEQAMPGYSFRMNEIAAAIGRAQLASMDARLSRLATVAALYQQALEGSAGGSALGLPQLELPGATRSWFTYPVLLPERVDRDAVRSRLVAAGIASAAYFPPLHRLPGLVDRVRICGPLSNSDDLGRRLLSLPLWSGMEEGEVAEVAEVLMAAM